MKLVKIIKRMLLMMLSLNLIMLTACSSQVGLENQQSTGDYSNEDSSQETSGQEEINADFDQFAPAEKGEQLAVIKVKDYGEITVKFFPQYAPMAVENFVDLAKDNSYNNSFFHRVIKDFMIQGGMPKDGSPAKSKWGENFGVEVNPNLHNYTGALCMARTPDMEKGQSSQFYIVQSTASGESTFSDAEYFSYVEQNISDNYGKEYTFTKEVIDNYKKHGGAPYLDMGYTVFGQVVSGMDVVNKIADTKVEFDEYGREKSVPVEDIIIESITLTTQE